MVDRHANKVLSAHGAAYFLLSEGAYSVSDIINASAAIIDTIISTLQYNHQFDPLLLSMKCDTKGGCYVARAVFMGCDRAYD